MKPIALILLALLSGCETSHVWYVTHPQKQVINVEGTEVSVVPRSAVWFDAWGGNLGFNPIPAPVLKERQIKAVELASRCKVVAAEYTGTRLQTTVAC